MFEFVISQTGRAQYRTGIGKFPPKDTIDPFLCTLVIYTFAKIDNQNKIAPYEWNEDELYAEVYNIKQKDIELKMLQAVGGWSYEGGPISPLSRMGSAASNSRTFIDSLLKY